MLHRGASASFLLQMTTHLHLVPSFLLPSVQLWKRDSHCIKTNPSAGSLHLRVYLVIWSLGYLVSTAVSACLVAPVFEDKFPLTVHALPYAPHVSACAQHNFSRWLPEFFFHFLTAVTFRLSAGHVHIRGLGFFTTLSVSDLKSPTSLFGLQTNFSKKQAHKYRI